MIQTRITVSGKEAIGPAWWRLSLSAPDLSPLLPGQFLLVRCADRFSCYLRRPVFPAQHHEGELSLLVRPAVDPGLAWLSARTAGDELDVIGPLGEGFPPLNPVRNLLLVSDGQSLSPLLGQLERAVAAGLAVTLVLGASRAAALYPPVALPPVVEFQAATLDGSLGYRGPVSDLLPDLLGWADLVCAVGTAGLYRTLQSQVKRVRLRLEPHFLYGLVTDRPMACGVGACTGCGLETQAGPKLACIDGPVFDLAELAI